MILKKHNPIYHGLKNWIMPPRWFYRYELQALTNLDVNMTSDPLLWVMCVEQPSVFIKGRWEVELYEKSSKGGIGGRFSWLAYEPCKINSHYRFLIYYWNKNWQETLKNQTVDIKEGENFCAKNLLSLRWMGWMKAKKLGTDSTAVVMRFIIVNPQIFILEMTRQQFRWEHWPLSQ